MTSFRSLFIALAAVLWSADALLRLPLTRDLPALAIVFMEHALAMGFVGYLIWRYRAYLKLLTARHWWALLVVGVGASALATVAFTASFSYVGPSVSILLQKTQPLFTFILAYVWLKERLPKKFWIWASLALVGAYLVSFPEIVPSLTFYSRGSVGVVLALVAAGLWGGATVFGRYLLADIPFPLVTALRFAVALPVLAILLGFYGGYGAVLGMSGKDLLFLVIIMLGPGFGAMFLYYFGLKVTRASVSALLELTWPLAAVILNWFVLGDKLTLLQIAGGLVLVGAVARLTLRPSGGDMDSNQTQVIATS